MRIIFTALLGLWFRPKVVGGSTSRTPARSSWLRSTGRSPTSGSPPSARTASSSSWPRTRCGRTSGWAGCCSTVGAFPVHRESADREALQRAEEVLAAGPVPGAVPRGHPPEGPPWRISWRVRIPLGPHGGADRAHRHRRLGPVHAQGQRHSEAVHHSGRHRPRRSRPPARTGAAGSPARPSTPPPKPSCPAVAGRLRRGPREDRPLLAGHGGCPTGGGAPCGPSTRSRGRPDRSASRRASSCPSWSCPRPGEPHAWARSLTRQPRFMAVISSSAVWYCGWTSRWPHRRAC
jgi:hypothetical protein